jgi:hypothetical protein
MEREHNPLQRVRQFITSCFQRRKSTRPKVVKWFQFNPYGCWVETALPGTLSKKSAPSVQHSSGHNEVTGYEFRYFITEFTRTLVPAADSRRLSWNRKNYLYVARLLLVAGPLKYKRFQICCDKFPYAV